MLKELKKIYKDCESNKRHLYRLLYGKVEKQQSLEDLEIPLPEKLF